jgi:hypothetical protein
MIAGIKMAAPIASIPVRWRLSSLAETVASVGVSAGCYRCSKDIGVMAVVITEFELGNVQRKILLADLVKRADNAALHQRPEALNGLSVHRADDYSPAA